MSINEYYDFSCWVIKYGRVSSNGKIFQKDCLLTIGDAIVPLLYNHNHFDLDAVLGYALLEDREDGIFAYCTLYDIPCKDMVIKAIKDGGSVQLSPYINQVKTDAKYITHGVIREVSLVPARIDPDECFRPVMRKHAAR